MKLGAAPSWDEYSQYMQKNVPNHPAKITMDESPVLMSKSSM
jgi:uncharacterized short protein YbdD (DUF466 family)